MSHKKHKEKYLSILLLPPNESSPRSLKLRYSWITLIGLVLVILFSGFVVGALTYGKMLQKAVENVSLHQENSNLKAQLEELSKLEDEIKVLRSYSQKVQKSLTGYVNIPDEYGKVASLISQDDLSENSKLSIFTDVPVKAPVKGFISQEFKDGVHNGIDIVAPEGTPIVSAGDGIVLFSGWTMDGGNTIIIGHGYGYYTYYKHNLRNIVYTSQEVHQGQPIAYLGNSGQKSYGPHLHFEIWKDGRPIDPLMLNLDLK